MDEVESIAKLEEECLARFEDYLSVVEPFLIERGWRAEARLCRNREVRDCRSPLYKSSIDLSIVEDLRLPPVHFDSFVIVCCGSIWARPSDVGPFLANTFRELLRERDG